MRRSISQYLDGVSISDDPEAESEWKELKKAKFEGKTIRGIELLAEVIGRQEEKLAGLKDQIHGIEEEIQKENKVLGEAKQRQKMKTDLEAKQKLFEELKPEVEKAVSQKTAAEEEAKGCEVLAEEIRELREKKAGLEAFLGKVQEAKGKERAIGEEKFTEEKLKQEKVSLEQALLENKEAQEGLKGVEAEKERLQNRLKEAMGKGEKLTGDEKALDQAVKEKKAAEENVLKLEMTGNNWKLQKEEMIKQENALAQAAGNEPLLQMKSQQLQEFLLQAGQLELVQKKLAETQKEYENAVVVRNREREIYGHLEQTFLDAQAGLLAKHLKEGERCPVCGSDHHPKPAVLTDKVPDKEFLDEKKEVLDQKEENVQKLSALAGQFKEQSEELWEQYRNKAEQIFGDAGAESLPEVKRRLSEAINNCDQKLKDAQKAAESLKKCQETKEALETNEKILQDKLLQARNIHSAAEGQMDLLIRQCIKNLQDEPKIQEMQQVPGIQSTNDIENVVSRIKMFFAELKAQNNTVLEQIKADLEENGKKTAVDADCVIVATGGMSYPSTGSTGDGYQWAQAAGLKVTALSPALVPFETAELETVKSLQGLSLKNVEATVSNGKKELYRDFGEMLFTHFGVSGPLMLSASSFCAKAIAKNPLKLSIDLKPALTEEQLDERILRDFAEAKNKQFKNSLNHLYPAKLVPVIIERSGIDPDKQVNEITKEERRRLVETTKALTFTLTGLRPFKEAIITQGGVDVKGINPSTMEAKKTENLYFAGEVLDVDAVTGGFNLQIAWSTGWAAGKAAAEKIQES